MNPEILKTVGQVAGIGGLALGIFLILFRDVIRKNVFSDLTKEQSYTLLRMIIILVWTIAIAGLIAWVYVETQVKNKVGGGGEAPKVVFQDVPNIRTMYLSIEGTTLLNRALRGIGFSQQDGFTLKPFWLKNEVFNDMMGNILNSNQAAN